MDWRQILTPELLSWLLPGAGGLLLGLLIASLIALRRIGLLRTEIAVRDSKLENQDALEKERQLALQRAEQTLTATFGSMASQSLRENNESFLNMAREHLGTHQEKARSDLQERQTAIETMVKPIREALQKTEQQIAAVEKERKEAYGSIREQLSAMSAGQASLQSETRNLVNALRRPEVRGQWGELTLRRLAELAGMVEYCDFYEQENTQTSEGRMRPDMIIRMPNGRELIVDVKTPLDAYLTAMECSDDISREAALKKHAENVRSRVRELSLKSYWASFEHSPEFVILFIPGDQFLAAALQRLPKLLEEALEQKVILATPTSLVALLKAVAYGWRQVALEENAKKIQALGEDLHQRLGAFSGHLSKLGRQLGSSVDSYNAAVGSLERNVLPGARKFTELGVSSRRQIESLNPIETAPRRPELAGPDRPDETPPLPRDTSDK
ncbi:MAG: DNA recombination protein RmuC [Gammaproteobacteria bacterium]